MSNPTLTLASRYAKALFSVALAKKKQDEVEKSLNIIEQAITESDELRKLIHNPTVSPKQLTKIFEKLAKKLNIDAITQDFIMVAIENKRVKVLPYFSQAFTKLYEDHKGIKHATVVSTAKLKKDQREAITKLLKSKDIKEIILHEKVNENILGGITITMGSVMFDGSIKGKLDRLQQQTKEAIVNF